MTLNLNKSDKELEKDLIQADEDAQTNTKHVKRVLLFIFLVIGLSAGGVIAFFGYSAHQDRLSRERMEAGGSEATATIDSHGVQLTWSEGSTTYEVSYTFELDGHVYRGESELALRPTERTHVVIYDPQNPSMNRLSPSIIRNKSSSNHEAVVTAIALVVLLLVLGSLWFATQFFYDLEPIEFPDEFKW